MTTVTYEAAGHRLRIAGGCHRGDNPTLQEALGTCAELAGSHLIVDLTAVTEIDQQVANDLVAAARRSRASGGTIALVRKHGTPVDDALAAAETAATGPGHRVRRRTPKSQPAPPYTPRSRGTARRGTPPSPGR
ncbi:STAS domain-containing protein [Nocardioides sp. URHA0020]|uniref:STAS domain-containing protein n=1 Tax=Nocardioides sp. URHA0020 TaxID=1380392 RepID=UPI0004901A2E|nr:hypothetical protein [Nocardioides sp. URHA0020]